METEMTAFYSQKSGKAKLFAIQCIKCKCICFYEWSKHTTEDDRGDAVAWFVAFLLAHTQSLCPSTLKDAVEDRPWCARLGKTLFGPNGVVDDRRESDNVDEDDAEMEVAWEQIASIWLSVSEVCFFCLLRKNESLLWFQ